MQRVFGRIWRLTARAVSGPRAWVGLLVFGIVFALLFVDLWVDVQMISWTRRFYDALENMDLPGALRELAVFAGLIGASAGIFLVSDYLKKWLRLRWRARLTDQALDGWTADHAFWHLRPGLSAQSLDNPDQRIAEDCDRYVDLALDFVLELVGRVVGLITYVVVLWGLTDFVLRLTLFGLGVEVPRYMVWLAPIYVLLGSIITHVMGRALKGLYFNQERREADFRHSLVQLRDNASEIAQAGGVAAERRHLDARFAGIRQNWHRLIRREAILGLFTRPYFQSVLRVPLFFALPAYFAGSVSFGGLMQLSAAFSRVTTTLSWFIFSYKELAEFVAVSERLDDLFRITRDPAPVPTAPVSITSATSRDGTLSTGGLRLATPEGRWLTPVPDMAILPGDRIWLQGASGEGKSSLVAALSGLWRYGEGHIDRPAAPLFVLPQRPHVASADLAAAACYPLDPADIGPGPLAEVLAHVGLGHRLQALARGETGTEGLSMGERQRLALARVFLHRPRWLVLDEATASLDSTAEAHLLSLLRRDLPETTILCVSHRKPVALDITGVWTLGTDIPQRRKSA